MYMADNKNKGFASSNYPQDVVEDARSEGGKVSSSDQNMSDLGQKGGEKTQHSDKKHKLTDAERSEGGEVSSSEQNMSELGREGGQK